MILGKGTIKSYNATPINIYNHRCIHTCIMFIICLYYVVVLLIISSIGSGSQFMGTIDGINKLLNQELRFKRFASFAVIFFSCFLFEFILQVFCLCFVIMDSCDFGITNPYKPFSSKLLWSWHFIKRWKSKGYISSLLFICPPFLSPLFFYPLSLPAKLPIFSYYFCSTWIILSPYIP